jgi:hypothetical protein
MRATNKSENLAPEKKLAVDTKELQEMLGCGRFTAYEIGTQAGARMQLGKRVLWNVTKIKSYLNCISE